MKDAFKSLALAFVASALAVVLVLIGLAACGYPPLTVGHEWIISPLSSGYDIAACLKYSCPLLLTGLAAGIAFRCGVLNIGAEGQAIMGAIAAVTIATRWVPQAAPWLVIILALLAGVTAGSLWALIAALLDRLRGVPVVLSTILLDFIAVYLLGFLLTGPLQAARTTAPESEQLSPALCLPVIATGTGLHAGVIFAFVLAGIAWVVLARTTFGFELLVTGMNPTAAVLSGIPVPRRQASVMLLSGSFAGLAGAVQLLGATHVLKPDFTGYGYAGIAVAMLGRLNPLGIAVAALFFGILDRGAEAVESNPDLTINHGIADIVKGVIVLVMLVGTAYLMRQRSTSKQPE